MTVASLSNILPPAASWWDWWLPPDYSQHGRQIDVLFNWVFWITAVVGIAVLVALAWFSVKYRHRPGRTKGVFTHGNTRLEMIWTLIPAVILIGIAIISKRVWDNYRYSPASTDPNRARVLVIGQQFIWNVVYPGPDGKLGRYLVYPKTTDLKWPDNPPGDKNPFQFPADVPGPAYLPEEKARAILNDYIDSKNQLGKDFSDPAGVDDIWADAVGKPVYLPRGRAVEISLTSRDVIHDFFAPDFRTKLDAVPGTRGTLFLTATVSSATFERETRQAYSLEQLKGLVSANIAPEYRPEYHLYIPDNDPRSDLADPNDPGTRRYSRESRSTALKAGEAVGKIGSEAFRALRQAGVTELTAQDPGEEGESGRHTYPVEQLEALKFRVAIPNDDPKSDLEDPKDPDSRRYHTEGGDTIVKNGLPVNKITAAKITALQTAGVSELPAHDPNDPDPNSRRRIALNDLKKMVKAIKFTVVIADKDPRSDLEDPKDPASRRYFQSKREVIPNDAPITPLTVADLESFGLKTVTVYRAKFWDVVCEQLCGVAHTTMRGQVRVLEPEEYKRRFETPAASPPGPSILRPPPIAAAGNGAAGASPGVSRLNVK